MRLEAALEEGGQGGVVRLGAVHVEARGEGQGLPGRRWRLANKTAAEQFERAASLPHRDWQDAEQIAFEALATQPNRRERDRLLRAKSTEFDFRTTLPDWFGGR